MAESNNEIDVAIQYVVDVFQFKYILLIQMKHDKNTNVTFFLLRFLPISILSLI
jgi:hypothetical protein